MTAQLSVSGLTMTYPAAASPALLDVRLAVEPGQCVGLLGPSGSGKTSLLRAIAGLSPTDTGSIRIGARDLTDRPPEQRGLAMVFQRPLLFPHLNVLDNVAFSARMKGANRRTARAGARRYLDLVQLDGLGRRNVKTLSGGQQQRVALARALAAEPSVLLLDEPFAALDPALRHDMHELLTELRAVLEPTVVLVTHDHQESSALADSIAVLVDGRIVQHDTAGRIYARPNSVTVNRLLGGRNEIDGTVTDNAHRSGLGDLYLPGDVDRPDGPAVLLIRQEAIAVTEPTDRSDMIGRVTSTTRTGARRVAAVAVGKHLLYAELAFNQRLDHGQPVGLHLDPEALTVVPSSDPSAPEQLLPGHGPRADELDTPSA